jgi:hypothetical protein
MFMENNYVNGEARVPQKQNTSMTLLTDEIPLNDQNRPVTAANFRLRPNTAAVPKNTKGGT